jgi:hypothetical protein
VKSGRPAKPWEWQRAILRRDWDELDGYLTPRRGTRLRPQTVKLVACALAGRMDGGGKCYPSQDTVAWDASLGRKAVGDAVACLEHFGWLRVYRDETDTGRKKGPATRSNSYYAAFPVRRQVGPGDPVTAAGVGPEDPLAGSQRTPDPPSGTHKDPRKIQGGAPSGPRPALRGGSDPSAGESVSRPNGHKGSEAPPPPAPEPEPEPEPEFLTFCSTCAIEMAVEAPCSHCKAHPLTLPREVAGRMLVKRRTERADRERAERVAYYARQPTTSQRFASLEREPKTPAW